MNKTLFFDKIKNLYDSSQFIEITNYKIESDKLMEKIDAEVERFLNTNPCDIEFLFRLAILVLHKHDYIQSIKFIDQIFKCDKDNLYALILLTYIYSTNEYIRDDLYQRLCKVKSESNDTQAIIEHLKSWYFQTKGDDVNYEKHLLESIKLKPDFVNNNSELGTLYIRLGKKKEAKSISKML